MIHFMSNKKLLYLAISLSGNLFSCQAQSTNIDEVEKDLLIVDMTVKVIEKFPKIGLRSEMLEIVKRIDNEIKKGWNVHNGEHVNKFIFNKLKQVENSVSNIGDDLLRNSYEALLHKANLLFYDSTVNNGLDFQESLLTDFHVQRHLTRDLSKIISVKDTLENKLNRTNREITKLIGEQAMMKTEMSLMNIKLTDVLSKANRSNDIANQSNVANSQFNWPSWKNRLASMDSVCIKTIENFLRTNSNGYRYGKRTTKCIIRKKETDKYIDCETAKNECTRK
jgi:hypothetical protein